MTISDYQNDKLKYIRLKNNISTIISGLKGFNTNVSSLKTKIANNYTINDQNTPVYNRIVKLGINSNKIKEYLLKTIVPAIDVAIKKCDSEISKLKAAEQANNKVSNSSNI